MSAFKIKWKVEPEPTGRYRAFDKRGWPHAEYPNGDWAAYISSESEYVPRNIKSGNHKPLVVHVYSYEHGAQARKTFKMTRTFATLEDAKAAAAYIIAQHPEFYPEGQK